MAHSSFDNLFPSNIKIVGDLIENLQGTLLGNEQEAIVDAIPKRQKEFRAGRTAARQALASLNAPESAIPVGENREPLWPQGFTGSITHTDTACYAVVASQKEVRALGLDLEERERLSPELWRLVFREDEKDWLKAFPDIEQNLWATLLFSAKEAFYKAQYAVTQNFLGFQEASLKLNLNQNTFTLEAPSLSQSHPEIFSNLCGHFAYSDRHVITGVSLR